MESRRGVRSPHCRTPSYHLTKQCPLPTSVGRQIWRTDHNALELALATMMVPWTLTRVYVVSHHERAVSGGEVSKPNCESSTTN